MTLSAAQITHIIGANNQNIDNSPISFLLTDSRDLTFPKETAFIALRTPGNDGHRYIGELYDKGVRHFIVDVDIAKYKAKYPDAVFWEVADSLKALQAIALHIRKQLTDFPIVGITGSRGKTIVKELLFKALYDKFQITRSPRSYNSQIGVPLSLWEITADTNLAILEAGISQKDEMQALTPLIDPNIGVFTSLTDEHADGFSSLEEKAAEKSKLFANCPIIFYDAANPIIEKALSATNPKSKLIPVNGGNKAIATAVADYLLANYLSAPYSISDVERRIAEDAEKLVPRFDVCDTLKDCQVVYDAFTNDYRSICDALNFQMRRMAPDLSATLILAKPDSSLTIDKLCKVFMAKGLKRFIGVGFSLQQINDFYAFGNSIDMHFASSVDDFLNTYTISDFNHEVILVKGTPADGFDDIKTLLEEPRHETVLEVDLGAITSNFNLFRSLLPPSEGLVAMVKADGYGIGSLELSKVLQGQGAAYLAVAVVDEGVALRRAGITMPIIVMNPLGTNYKALFDNKLEPSVFSIRELKLLLDNAARLGVKNYPVHVKLDTGMHRLGFVQNELAELLDVLNNQDLVKVKSIFSHLATADCLDQDEYTEKQLSNFESMSQILVNGLSYKVLRHILNTAGMLRYPQYHYDMARLGIGLYGISPLPNNSLGIANDASKAKLKVVARLFSTIISIKEWQPGTTIGYGRRGIVDKPSIIATVPIGYADGLDRHLSRGNAYFLVNGVQCPIVGNICMDQCMIDVTEANANIGDKVEIFGENAPIERLSDTLETIPYEILTSISPRVKRIYFRQ